MILKIIFVGTFLLEYVKNGYLLIELEDRIQPPITPSTPGQYHDNILTAKYFLLKKL